MTKLVLGEDGGGPRHYLEGRPVHAGSYLVVLTQKGWVTTRYEAEWTDNSIIAQLLFPDGKVMQLEQDVELRWPTVHETGGNKFPLRDWEFRDAPDGTAHLVSKTTGFAYCGLDCRMFPLAPARSADPDYPRFGVIYGQVQCEECCRDLPPG